MRNANKEITKKHDHSLTNLLKGALFSLVMMAPILSITVRCGYVMFNKNAYESYYGETINQITLVNTQINNLQAYKNYEYRNELINDSTNSSFTVYPLNNKVNWDGTEIDDVNYFIFYVSGSTPYLAIRKNNTSSNSNHINLSTTQATIKFELDTILYSTTTNTAFNYFYKVEYNNYSFLDNAFTYGIANLKNEAVFNWTKNTALYQPINAMCTGLGITEQAIAIMLTYWSLMTAIYIIFDIVIVLFTKLTHLLN